MKASRIDLLPSVLKSNPYFVELMEATDSVFASLDSKVAIISDLRNPYATDELIEAKIAKGEMLDLGDWPQSPSLDQQLQFLGLPKNIEYPQTKLLALWYISRYWRQKRRRALDFAEFCFNKSWLTWLT